MRLANASSWRATLIVLVALCACDVSFAARLSKADLLQALRGGGLVLVMRHANSPGAPPAPEAVSSGNVKHERQLDAAGRTDAATIGAALRELRIPSGQVWSSPTYRALETVQRASLGKARVAMELDEGEQGMRGPAEPSRSSWLRRKAAEAPHRGSNTIVVTHAPNILSAFGSDAAAVAAGEVLVFRPDGKGGAELIGRIKPSDWSEFTR